MRSEPSALLLRWFAQNARPLPWRKNYDPYEVTVSEFMLQQTQVDTVLPYFERWMRRFPDLKALAAADEAEVVKLWEGLGYYSRARNLLKAAKAMVEEGYREPPEDVEKLLSYPGFGPYTAGAVASIGRNRPVAAVDGNVERVTARFCNLEDPAGSPGLKKTVTKIVLELIPKGEARAFNQALMELGALVCLPKNPKCDECPWKKLCIARQLGVQALRPLPKRRPETLKTDAWAVLCLWKGACLLRKRPAKGLWANMWEIPWFARRTENSRSDIADWARGEGFECFSFDERGSVRFSFTRHQVNAWFVVCSLKGISPLLKAKIKTEEWGLFSVEEMASLTLPSPSRKCLSLLETTRYTW
ncbi:MAG: A/G-specific adenine glycosylase [Synergistaceae bacterium]|jgi:A/G-specific adenine glycosylase|nr:A/G-specific adenine glycosylase [Synergistaceae bacterium]